MAANFNPRTPKRTNLHLEEKPKVVIVCEGTETEIGYFNAIRTHLRLSDFLIPVLHSGATNPRNIVAFAAAKRKEQIRLRIWDEKVRGDSVWAVYDGVEHYYHNKRDWDEALDLAKSNNVQLAITNPSFELWYLLHFQEQTGWIERDAAYIQLKEKHIKTYEKGNVLYPEPLKARTNVAIERARRLAKYAQENNLKLHECLCAEGVADLVTLLLSLSPPT